MKSIALLSVVLGTLLLGSCTNARQTEVIPYKAFQYSYQQPSRVQTSSSFSRQLSSGKAGSIIKTVLSNKHTSTVRLGHTYYSANGHSCRGYTLMPSYQHTACKVNGRWYQASPILISKQN